MSRRTLTDEAAEALRGCEHLSRIITNAAVRSQLKRWGYIAACPAQRKYRHMPYSLTPAGAEALRAYDAAREAEA